jgi:hypothetical protein
MPVTALEPLAGASSQARGTGLVSISIPVAAIARNGNAAMNTNPVKRRPFRYDADLLEDARVLFQNRYGRPVNTEEAREMLDNLVGFFRTLHLWRHAQLKRATSRNRSTSTEQVALVPTPEPTELAARQTDPLIEPNERPETGLHLSLKRMRRRRFGSERQSTKPNRLN